MSSPSSRPSTVTFNVDYTRPSTAIRPQTNDDGSYITRKSKIKKTIVPKTADLSHTTDRRPKTMLPSFIPDEFKREVTTPTPLRPGTGVLDVTENKWRTQVFPTESGTSRTEVEMLGEWLNQVLEKNQNETKNPHQLAENARHWYEIAYEELCRQITAECPERAQLLSSIWHRYQSLFARVAQLHEEERNYLVRMHHERTTLLKGQLDQTQSKLKIITQQYRDDQERWSNSREREETKFANMRKKLDLQVKNKRNLLLQIKSLKEQLGQPSMEQFTQSAEEETPEEDTGITQQQLSDRVQALRQRVRNDFSHMYNVTMTLDDLAHYVDQDRASSKNTRDYFPHIFHRLRIGFQGKIRTVEWAMSFLTFFYGQRITDLCKNRFSLKYQYDRLYLADEIYELFLRVFGKPLKASEAFYDMLQTMRSLASTNQRAALFLKFLDASNEYCDSIYLDFYLFCVSTYFITNPEARDLYPDVFTEEEAQVGQMPCSLALEGTKKILYSICENDIADKNLDEMKKKFNITNSPEDKVSIDLLLDFIFDLYKSEEEKQAEQLREQYEMDAAQYGGIVTLGQFQTLVMFSSKKLDYKVYTEMMKNTFIRSQTKTISFNTLMAEMHKYSMLVPFVFDRIDYDLEDHPRDYFNFIENEYKFNLPNIEIIMEKIRKSDDNLFKSLQTVKAKFEQVIDTKRTGFFTEVAQREFYEKFDIEVE